MLVPMVRIRHMRMRMAHRFVHVSMAVRARRHHLVRVVMVPVVMPVRMLVFQRLVRVRMPMRFRQVQRHPQHH